MVASVIKGLRLYLLRRMMKFLWRIEMALGKLGRHLYWWPWGSIHTYDLADLVSLARERGARMHYRLTHDPYEADRLQAKVTAMVNHPSYGPHAPLDPDGYDPYGHHVGRWNE